MKKQIEEDYLFDFEKDSNEQEKKEFYYFEDNMLITIKFHIIEKKLQELKQYLKNKYVYNKSETRKNVVLNTNYKNESFNSDGYIIQTIISNIHKETKIEKIGLLKTKETVISYGDVTRTYQLKPIILSIIEGIELRKYLNLVNLYNYIITCTKMDPSLKMYTYLGTNRTLLSKFNDLRIVPNDKESSLTSEETLEILNRLFDCFEITEIKKNPIVNNQISVDIDSTYDELINLKSKIKLADLNTKIISSNILDNGFGELRKILIKNNA